MTTGARVLITGGSGRVGSHVINELRSHSYRIVNIDLRPADGVETLQVDVTKPGEVQDIQGRFDAIVHLAAIPSLRRHSPQEVFGTNVVAAHNLLEFAYSRQIKKVVMASSEAVMGMANSYRTPSLVFLPIDEEHPNLAQDAYGLSKLVQEQLATGFVLRSPDMSIVNLRFAWVLDRTGYDAAVRDVRSRPEVGVRKLFSYVSVMDAGRACRLALEYKSVGDEVFFIAADDTLSADSSASLAATYFSRAQIRSGCLAGRESLLDCRKARRLLHFSPMSSWPDGARGV